MYPCSYSVLLTAQAIKIVSLIVHVKFIHYHNRCHFCKGRSDDAVNHIVRIIMCITMCVGTDNYIQR